MARERWLVMPTVPISSSITWAWALAPVPPFVPTPQPSPGPPSVYQLFVPDRRRKITRDILRMNRQMRRYQQEMGEYVRWFEYDTVHSTSHFIYDEGPSRRYLPVKQVPAMFVMFQQPVDVPEQEGRYIITSIHATFTVDQIIKAGISNPLKTGEHYSDRIEFNGHLYRIERYEPQGYLHGQYMTIGVDAHEVKDEELQEDEANPF